MLQFKFDKKLDPDGSELHKLLEAQITYEQTSAFRSLYSSAWIDNATRHAAEVSFGSAMNCRKLWAF